MGGVLSDRFVGKVLHDFDYAVARADYDTAQNFESCADISPSGADEMQVRRACVSYAPGNSPWEFVPQLVINYGPQGGNTIVLEGYPIELHEDSEFLRALRDRLVDALSRAVSEAEQDVWKYLLDRALDSISRRHKQCRYDENSGTMVCDFYGSGDSGQVLAEYRFYFR